jgi:cell division protein FtsQ
VVSAGVAGGLFTTVIGLLGHQVATGEHWEVDQVQVAGNLHASEASIRHLADVTPGTHLLTIDLREIAKSVERHPWVARVEVRRMLPSTVEVVVEEHDPKLLLAMDRLWLVGADGTAFKQARGELLNFPVLSGIDPQLAIMRPDLASAIVHGALQVLEIAEGHPWVGPATISELRFEDTLGFTAVTRNGSELILGFGYPDRALERLDRLVAAGLDMSIPQRIDLDAGSVAIATPLPSPQALISRP